MSAVLPNNGMVAGLGHALDAQARRSTLVAEASRVQSLESTLRQIKASAEFALTGANFDLQRCVDLIEQSLANTTITTAEAS